jgi:hypothetical protein
MRSRRASLFLICALLLCVTSAAATDPLAIAFSQKEVTASGFTPKAPVVFFSVANQTGQFYATLVRREKVVTADSSGTAVYKLDEDLPRRSVWFAINLRTGEFAVAAPPTFPLRPTLPQPTLARDSATGLDLVDLSADYAEILVVQPGMGAWTDSVAKGSLKDLNRTGLSLRTTPSSFLAVDKSNTHPDHLTPADLLIIVDPHSLRFFAGRAVPR